ncbi:hypothetical protein BAUCODRAFT_38080 [Baudoinia panamericana UAMH 10762]|uniref:Uncharacterized protein n=1 Tax=Baudoinia panamericana (strain UAMH 10762) TaxID=717646 RepID=M2M704_BAUPA|nr:uncharacterized protein BAUCODRAFT_38080 [Baudoinia panamericana UAMH 10762]EMC92061.1 hypothetical protein BAUCODRAFT_38080 [Baudoinia panamericana UAMH 10762]
MTTASNRAEPFSLAQHTARPRALPDLHLDVASVDYGVSSEDEPLELQDGVIDNAETALGISIGREQTRLTSPKTPAVEKAAAIEESGGFFPGRVGGTVEEERQAEAGVEEDALGKVATEGGHWKTNTRTQTDERKKDGEARHPSPWRGSAALHGKDSWVDNLFSRRRPLARGRQRSLTAGFTSLSSRFFPGSRHDGDASSELTGDEIYGRTDPQFEESPRHQDELDGVGDLPAKPRVLATRSGHSQLRRSASDESLLTSRTLSRVPSLGDDSRFEDVQEQINGRLRAIKDTWRESSVRLPSFRPDFLREGTGSLLHTHRSEKPMDPMTGQPYHAAKQAIADAGSAKPNSHPHLKHAMEQLEGDVVILGGYRGSILRSAQPPHRQLWIPVKAGLNLRRVDLEVGLRAEDDGLASKKVMPDGMLSHIGPVDISRRLLKHLRACENARSGKLRVHDYGYDWRLDPALLSDKMISFLESLPCNAAGVARENRGATIVAHSLGGLITRHAVNRRAELFKGVVYAGVPNHCVNILGPLRNGDEVLLSSRILTAQVNFTIRTSYALLPLDGRCFLDKNTKEEYPVDFFDPKTWLEYRLSPCIARPLPPLIVHEKPTGLSSYVSSVANALPSLPLPGRRGSLLRSKASTNDTVETAVSGAITEPDSLGSAHSGKAVSSGNVDWSSTGRDADSDAETSIRTAVTIPFEDAMAYLTRTLAAVKKFRQEQAFEPTLAASNRYPPISVLYGKTTPTVYGAKVDGREGIKHADAYDQLAFASGDGVVLARAAMVPEGYTTAHDGIISSERGHVTLLGDLEGVGRCLNAVIAARRRGVGCGNAKS